MTLITQTRSEWDRDSEVAYRIVCDECGSDLGLPRSAYRLVKLANVSLHIFVHNKRGEAEDVCDACLGKALEIKVASEDLRPPSMESPGQRKRASRSGKATLSNRS